MAKSVEERFGEALARLRREKGIAQDDLTAVHRTYLSELERGLKSPTLGTIVRLAEELQVSPDQLVALATAPEETGREGSPLAAVLSDALELAKEPGKTPKPSRLLSGTSALADVETLARTSHVELERVRAEAALLAFRNRAGGRSRTSRDSLTFLLADSRPEEPRIYTDRSAERWSLNPPVVLQAMRAANRTIELIHDLILAYNVPIFELLGLRNLSSFVGSIFA